MRLSSEKRTVKGVGLTPLIDVVFLLLIFFMLASTFLRFSYLLVTSSSAGGTSSAIGQAISVHVGSGGKVDVNGEPVPVEALAMRLDELAAGGADKAVVRVSAEASVQELVSVLEQAKRSQLQSVSVAR